MRRLVMMLLIMGMAGSVSAQELQQKDAMKEQPSLVNTFCAMAGTMYGFAYPAGTIDAVNGHVERERDTFFGGTIGFGYQLSPLFLIHGGFTLWDAEVSVKRNLLGQKLETRYCLDTCALHAGLMMVYKWFYVDCMLFTELPLEDDTEKVYLSGEYMQTNRLKSRYEYGGFLGLGARIPVTEQFFVLVGIYGGGGFVPSLESSRGDELYLINATIRISVMVYVL